MRLSFKAEKVLAVVAHPDDADLLCGGTLARAKADGAAVAICVLCKGDKGQPSAKKENLAARRQKEMTASAELLEAKLFTTGVPDGTLTDDTQTRRFLIEIFRQFKPTLILAHAPEDYHPDHRAASLLAEAASWFCASRGHKTKSPALASSPALWWMDTVDMSGFTPGFYLDISAQLPLKTQMLACHHSQLARGKDSDFSPLAELMRLQYCTRGLQAGVKAAEAFRAHFAFKRGRAW
jgi:LmbE family N-acetylglucosaminyl deacetylase